MNSIKDLLPGSMRERTFQLKARRDAGAVWNDPQFVECKKCGRRATRQIWNKAQYVCPNCGVHLAIGAYYRLSTVLDHGTFKELNPDIAPNDVLHFPDYQEKLAAASVKTGLKEAAVTATGRIGGVQAVAAVLDSRFFMGSMSTAVGDEGGFAPRLNSAEDALDCIAQAVDKAGYRFGEDISIALDVASSEFYEPESGLYIFKKSDGSRRTAAELTDYYVELKKKYPIVSIEDGCAENDWDGWKILTEKLGKSTQLVGDDLFVTNVEFLRKGIHLGVGNSILVKVNQIGSLTETLDAVELAMGNRYTAVISHRSGETEDATIADIAVGTNAGQIKTGSLSRSDRMAKYNRLLRIEEELGESARYGNGFGLF